MNRDKANFTSKQLEQMWQQYVSGTALTKIADNFGVTYGAISYRLKLYKPDDYDRVRFERKERVAHSQATTNIYRAGTIGNNRGIGPNSRQAFGQNRASLNRGSRFPNQY